MADFVALVFARPSASCWRARRAVTPCLRLNAALRRPPGLSRLGRLTGRACSRVTGCGPLFFLRSCVVPRTQLRLEPVPPLEERFDVALPRVALLLLLRCQVRARLARVRGLVRVVLLLEHHVHLGDRPLVGALEQPRRDDGLVRSRRRGPRYDLDEL
jgi:hypothetical protein